jgi:hypothetical protein
MFLVDLVPSGQVAHVGLPQAVSVRVVQPKESVGPDPVQPASPHAQRE